MFKHEIYNHILPKVIKATLRMLLMTFVVYVAVAFEASIDSK